MEIFDITLNEIKADLADNYNDDDESVLTSILTDVISDALFISNRSETDNNLKILKSNIKKATKTIYLQRGVEDVASNSQNGLNNTYANAIAVMQSDIIIQNKRLLK